MRPATVVARRADRRRRRDPDVVTGSDNAPVDRLLTTTRAVQAPRSFPPGSALGRARVPATRDPSAHGREHAALALAGGRRRGDARRARGVVPQARRPLPRRVPQRGARRREPGARLVGVPHRAPARGPGVRDPVHSRAAPGNAVERRGRGVLRFDPSRACGASSSRCAAAGSGRSSRPCTSRTSARPASCSAFPKPSRRPRSSPSRTRSAPTSNPRLAVRSKRSRTGTVGSRRRDGRVGARSERVAPLFARPDPVGGVDR